MDDDGGARAFRGSPLSASVLVLNRNWTAIRVVSARRAFILLYRSSAEVIEVHEEQFGTFDFQKWLGLSRVRNERPAGWDEFVRTPRHAILVPRVIRLLGYDKVPRREVRFSRRNVLARDGNRCQYCGKKLPASQLSLDHVTPRSRGGRSGWGNVVTACTPCNTKKGGRLPAEACMKLQRAPAPPKRNPALVDKVMSQAYQIWRHFLGESEMAIDA